MRAIVLTQLVERLRLTSENCCSNPVNGKILSNNCTKEKTRVKKKEAGNDQSS